MKTTPILPGILGRESSPGMQIIHAAEKDQWMASLAAGQILKGRIMRHYGESRYGVSFGGQERVVDSAIPLSVGDVLTGRVVGVSERSVSMQLVPKDKTRQADAEIPVKSQADGLRFSNQKSIYEAMERLGIQLNQLEVNLLENAAKGFEQPAMAIRVGLYLAKLGIPISSELVKSMARRVLESQPLSSSRLNTNVPELVSESFESTSNAENPSENAILESLIGYLSGQYVSEQKGNWELADEAELGRFLKAHPEAVKTPTSSREQSYKLNEDSKHQAEDKFLAHFSRMLNAQTGSAYQHRFQTLPIVMNGRLVEFDLALFDHASDETMEAGVRNRHLKFSLTTEFGLVNLDAHILNNRVHLQLASDSKWLAQEFEQFRPELSRSLDAAGWVLESADYKSGVDVVRPAAAIIEHVLAQDSLEKSM